jgi:hypothetical protein
MRRRAVRGRKRRDGAGSWFGRPSEEIDRDQVPDMVDEKGSPGLRGLGPPRRHQPGDCALRHVEAELEELAMDARGAPKGVRGGHAGNESPDLGIDGRATSSGAARELGQYARKRRRCHRRTVSGVTITRDCLHPAQILASPAQKSRSLVRSLRGLAAQGALGAFVDDVRAQIDPGAFDGVSNYQLMLSRKQSPGLKENVEVAVRQVVQSLDRIGRESEEAFTREHRRRHRHRRVSPGLKGHRRNQRTSGAADPVGLRRPRSRRRPCYARAAT